MTYDFSVPNLSTETKILFFWLDTGCCVIFLFNFFFELWLADSKRWYWRSHIIDFVTSIPIPSTEVLRVGRAVRLTRLTRIFRFARIIRFIRLVRVLKFLRMFFFIWRGLDHLAEIFDVKLMMKSLIYCLLVLIAGAVIIYYIEGDSGEAGVSNIPESIWWSFTTVVTGGFGDIYNPQTTIGRFLTTALIIAGMILVGVFTATLTTIMVDDSEEIKGLKHEIDEFTREINEKLNTIAQKIDRPEQ